ncbi:MAG TPA: hypothetical protein VJB94_04295 [Candidatus Nanoarchaeia archaeon]|nr:hypothetical protein [Candidatus Nanoarchaeia archaeon]
MKEASWSDCIESNSAKKVSPDLERAKSLIETAEERIKIIGEIDEKNCNFVFEDYYTSLLELLQALVIREGYAVLNQLCLGYYIRDILKRNDLYVIFDDVGYKINSLTYYGNRMDFETAIPAIDKCKKLIKEIKDIKQNKGDKS